jgi:hypothetical protein
MTPCHRGNWMFPMSDRIVRCTGTRTFQSWTAGVPDKDSETGRAGSQRQTQTFPAPEGLFIHDGDFGMFARLRSIETEAVIAWPKHQLENVDDTNS